MEDLKCKNCFGTLVRQSDGTYKCQSCGSVFDDRTSSDEEKQLLVAAYKLLRDGEFDEADSSFRDIIDSHPRNHEAYYGRALCKHGIIFVDDIRANKKVPTCYITEIGSFKNDSNYKKALEYAPDAVKEEYIRQGNLIESIIDEWKTKASKQHYDIFISFKDTIDGERTKDSYEAQALYTHLIQKGYKVFFSRETLRELVSERYEPYIFNAINVAPIMIVYGQSRDNFESTWVRNEWSRFIKKISNGEKDKSGLIVCFENMTASNLPKEFNAIECMDASLKTFYGDLDSTIEKVLQKVKKPVSEIETIKTEYGKVGKKAKKLNYSEVKVCKIGSTTVEKVNQTDEFILNSAKKYFDHGAYEDCNRQLEQFLLNNEYNYEANLLKALVASKRSTLEDYIKNISTEKEINKIKFLISIAVKQDALKIIDLLYAKLNDLFDSGSDFWVKIFKVLVELDFKDNTKMRYDCITKMVESAKYLNYFDEIICYINNEDVDFHIKMRLQLIEELFKNVALRTSLGIKPQKYIDEVEEIDEGNIENLTFKLYSEFGAGTFNDLISRISYNEEKFFQHFEGILKFTTEEDISKLEDKYLSEICNVILTSKQVEETAGLLNIFDRLIRYVPAKDKKCIARNIKLLTKVLYEKQYYNGCVDYCNILLNYTDKKDEVIFLILLCKVGCPNYSKDNEIAYCKEKINSFDEWNVLLSHENEKIEAELFNLYNAQLNEEKLIEEEKGRKQKALSQLQGPNGINKRVNRIVAKRRAKIGLSIGIKLALVLAAAILIFDRGGALANVIGSGIYILAIQLNVIFAGIFIGFLVFLKKQFKLDYKRRKVVTIFFVLLTILLIFIQVFSIIRNSISGDFEARYQINDVLFVLLLTLGLIVGMITTGIIKKAINKSKKIDTSKREEKNLLEMQKNQLAIVNSANNHLGRSGVAEFVRNKRMEEYEKILSIKQSKNPESTN